MFLTCSLWFLLHWYGVHRDLHLLSHYFPTRRSSVLCASRKGWGLRAKLDSRGAHLWREFWRNLVGALPVSLDILKANYWLVPFSADDPLHTPNTLNVALPTVALAFGDAIKTVMTSGYAFDEMLGDIQHPARSEEHTSELQSLMRISYAVF